MTGLGGVAGSKGCLTVACFRPARHHTPMHTRPRPLTCTLNNAHVPSHIQMCAVTHAHAPSHMAQTPCPAKLPVPHCLRSTICPTGYQLDPLITAAMNTQPAINCTDNTAYKLYSCTGLRLNTMSFNVETSQNPANPNVSSPKGVGEGGGRRGLKRGPRAPISCPNALL